jgi:hypothetical protein
LGQSRGSASDGGSEKEKLDRGTPPLPSRLMYKNRFFRKWLIARLFTKKRFLCFQNKEGLWASTVLLSAYLHRGRFGCKMLREYELSRKNT